MIDCDKPPGANNYAFGSWAQFSGNGYWESSNEQIQPRSLYYAQLAARLGNEVMNRSFILPMETEASSSPPVDVAMALTKKAYIPAPTLFEWIDSVSKMKKISVAATGARIINESIVQITESKKIAGMKIMNGWLVKDGKILAGGRQDVQWWSGGILPTDLPKSKPHITRFVPGRTGTGLTDDLDSVTEAMKNNGILAIEHNYGLWYERRRDDHERIRRMDGDVWAPFYELPFQRSGIDSAWDGLSKYDLTKYNPFYWGRLKEFAELADQEGLLLVHQHYFQHNIIEAGAHYADFPWRTANNINHTGFPEPVPYAGDKRIFMAEQFYDIGNPIRRELHKKYIRQCLNNFKDNGSVIQLIGEEFTGPTHFVKFWLDVIKEWEKETGKKPVIGLSVTKDVQDWILNNPAYAAVVDLIDIRYWHYQADGTVYAPIGGQNLAPRQHARLLKPKKTSFEQVYRAVKEYRLRYPGKAIVYSGDSYPEFGMAVLMAGGSLPVLAANVDAGLLKAAAGMKPVDSANKNEYVLSDGKNKIVYNIETKKLEKRSQ
jgi:hypothetical protein